jgi:hypothetical protein
MLFQKSMLRGVKKMHDQHGAPNCLVIFLSSAISLLRSLSFTWLQPTPGKLQTSLAFSAALPPADHKHLSAYLLLFRLNPF